MSQDVIAVIRACGERTLGLCQQSLVNAIPKDRIFIVQEVPFEAALRKTYQIGIESGASHTLTVDADVIFSTDGVDRLLELRNRCRTEIFQLEGRLFDKLTGRFRQVGHRLYTTKLLSKAINLIPAQGAQVRPEDYVVSQMAARGYLSRHYPEVLGVHDFEQFYRDIYRKTVVHAHKHVSMIGHLIDLCIRNKNQDPDYLVALEGLCAGLCSQSQPVIDARKYADAAAETIRRLGLVEKSASLPGVFSAESELQRIKSIPAALPVIYGKSLSRMETMKHLLNEWGFSRTAAMVVSSALFQAAKRVRQLATNSA